MLLESVFLGARRLGSFQAAWLLLLPKDRRRVFPVLVIFVVATVLETAMVAAVLPFLSVIAAPEGAVASGRVAQLMAYLDIAPGYPTIAALGMLALAAILLSAVGAVVRTYWIHEFATRIAVVTSARVLSAHLRQPYEFFLEHHSGELSNMVLNEAAQVMDQFFLPVAQCIAYVLTVVALVLLVCIVDPVIAISSIVVLGGIYALSYWFSRNLIVRLSESRISANEDRSRTVIEAYGGIKEIKLSGHEAGYLHRYSTASMRLAHAMTYTNVIGEVPRIVVQTAAFAGIILLCLFVISTRKEGDSLSSLLPLLGVFAFAGQRLLPALGQVYSNATRLRSGGAIIIRLARELSRSASDDDMAGAQVAPMPLRHELRLDRVSFTYRTAEKPSLTDISLTIRAAERIGVIGLTGAGKTTLVDLMLGLLHARTGQITVDGKPLDADCLPNWQRSIGYVPQDIFLKDGTILENIAFGVTPDQIDRSRAIRCGRLAQLEEFVLNSLPQQWDTPVGERGARLSGGQKQRVGIARALYARASVLVFDEATSALDGVTEIEVMKAINALGADKTVFLIAHRLSTLRDCDRIILLDGGKLIGLGTWDSLIETSQQFRTMVGAAGLGNQSAVSLADPAAKFAS